MLEGSLPFNENDYEFEIEKPNQVELDSQIALLKLRLKSDLPSGEQYNEPPVEEQDQTEKLATGFGFFAYTADDREGTGVTYVGEWLNFKRHGRGVLRNHLQQWEYRGTFTCNQIDGFGQYLWKSGDTYVGWFNSQTQKEGFGSYTWASTGSKYEGFWQNNKKTGLGRYVYTDKSVYFGYYYNDKPDGIGIYKWPDGNFYQGEWKNGVRSGVGKFKFSQQESFYIGEFRNN